MEPVQTRLRCYGFDLIRLICFAAIIDFQTAFFYFSNASFMKSRELLFLQVIEFLCRSFGFGGFAIVFLSSLLIGLAQSISTLKRNLLGVLFFGWLYLTLTSHSGELVVWDVYPLFVVALLIIAFVEKRGVQALRGLGLLGAGLLWIPFWQFSPFFATWPQQVQDVLGVATCGKHELPEWPVFPWIGLIWFGYGVGRELKLRAAGPKSFLREIRWPEAGLWIPLLLAAMPQWGAFYSIRLGSFFSCDAYRLPPVVFWSHLIWVLAAVRLSIDPRVQSFLSKKAWVRGVSNMAISRKFWLAYAVHYLYAVFLFIPALAWLKGNFYALYMANEDLVINVSAFTLLIQCELLTRGVLACWAWLRHWYPRVMQKLHKAAG